MKARRYRLFRPTLTSAVWLAVVALAWGGAAQLPERFSDMEPGQSVVGWQALTFPKIESHTRYALVEDGDRVVLRADSQASASGLIRQLNIDPRTLPVLSWQWKVSRTIEKGDVKRQSGDDYAARIYITFNESSDSLSWIQRSKLAAIRLLYGNTPPSAALTYIWGNRAPVDSIHPNPYTDRVQMIVVDSGRSHANQWRSVQRNLVDDFIRAFGTEPPNISAIAVMTDSDNTGEAVTAWYGDIRFKRMVGK